MNDVTILSIEQGSKNSWGSVAKITPNLLKGVLAKPPNTMLHIPVPNYGDSDNGEIPLQIIEDALKTTPGKKVIVGNSTGAAYIGKYFRDRGEYCDIPADELSLLLLANPERKYGGWTRVSKPPTIPWEIGALGKSGLPDDFPWPITDFAQRYDLVADAPNGPNPGLAIRTYALTVGLALHMNYYTVGLDDPSVLSYTEGNITYLLHSPKIRPALESSYNRPPFSGL
jgi:hypothetical protein